MTVDQSGALYGTTSDGGQIDGAGVGVLYQLTPPPAGQTAWRETILVTFGEGAVHSEDPYSAPVIDSSGDLIGTTASNFYTEGGSVYNMAIFELTPPAAGKTAWTETVLHRFTGNADGAYPYGGLLLLNGALYGTTTAGGANGSGTVFKLVP